MRNKRILSRARIDAALLAAFDYPLTILEAPMGYGKTTAVKMFTRNQGVRAFWFTFSALSYSETAFWDSFTDHIMEMDGQAGAVLKSLGLPADAPQMERVLRTLGKVKFAAHSLLVLDDYHLARDARLNSLLLRLAQEELEDLSILLVTRDTTGLDFVELLSRGQCCLLPRQFLKFTEEELGDYCRLMWSHISAADLDKVWQYTDGWISFAHILLLGLETGIPVGVSTTIENMIEGALFNRYDSAMQDFLLRLSIMEEFTAEQAAIITQHEDARQRLSLLGRENAFVFYEEKTERYQIHQVLLNYLRRKRQFSGAELQALYGRLGDWLLGRQEFLPAYRYLHQAGRAEDVLAHLNDPKNIRNQWLDFDGADEMFNSAPRALLFRYPFAYLLYLFYSIVLGKDNAVLGWAERLDELEQHYLAAEGLDKTFQNRILGEILIVRKFTLFNDVAGMKASNQEIERLLNGRNSYITLQDNEFTFASPHYLYLYFRDKGGFHELAELLSENVGYAKFSGGCGTGSDALAAAEYALETGDFKNVAPQCRKAIAKAEVMSQAGIIICANFALIRLRLTEGKLPEAMSLLAQTEREVEKLNSSVYNTTMDLCKGYVFACLGQPERIPSWLQVGEIKAADFFSQGLAFNYIVYGKTLLVLGKYTELESRIEQFEEAFSVFGNRLGFIHNRIFEAAARCHLYGMKDGAAVLETALAEAEEDSLVLPFAENAPHMMGMLKMIARKNPGNGFLNRVLILCREYESMALGLSHPAETLSQREIDILSLAAQGLSRKEVAARLYISEETVKTHFKNVYQKLGVNSKMAAIRLARDRGYLGRAET
ncbi:MAG: LuxR C-terminal-related transcriptional regulator [Syntrophomonadaceae bacterium]|nr:LuxR C-terminal-related transcriptional regulator [Syntrophomonadaceae bacterium]